MYTHTQTHLHIPVQWLVTQTFSNDLKDPSTKVWLALYTFLCYGLLGLNLSAIQAMLLPKALDSFVIML